MVVEEGWPHGGVGANLAALIQEQAFDHLDAPIQRVTGADVPMPYSKALEQAAIPHEEHVVTAAIATFRMSEKAVGDVEAGSGKQRTKPPPKFETFEQLPHEPPYETSLLEELGVRGLQCGSAGILRFGPWLNSDLTAVRIADGGVPEFDRLSRIDGRLFLRHDAMQRFPFEDESFDWVYSEHFIEHFFPTEVVTWLTEMKRLLRPGGHMRISTPDLRKYVRGYLEPDNGFFAEHYKLLDHALGRFYQG